MYLYWGRQMSNRNLEMRLQMELAGVLFHNYLLGTDTLLERVQSCGLAVSVSGPANKLCWGFEPLWWISSTIFWRFCSQDLFLLPHLAHKLRIHLPSLPFFCCCSFAWNHQLRPVTKIHKSLHLFHFSPENYSSFCTYQPLVDSWPLFLTLTLFISHQNKTFCRFTTPPSHLLPQKCSHLNGFPKSGTPNGFQFSPRNLQPTHCLHLCSVTSCSSSSPQNPVQSTLTKIPQLPKCLWPQPTRKWWHTQFLFDRQESWGYPQPRSKECEQILIWRLFAFYLSNLQGSASRSPLWRPGNSLAGTSWF